MSRNRRSASASPSSRSPTEQGASYYARCAAIAAQIDDANREVQRGRDEPMGLLRVSAPALYGRRFLAPVVARYLEAHAHVRVEVALADRRVDLVEEGFDLAIRVGRLDDSSLTAKRLGDAHSYYVASPAFLSQHGRPSPAALRSSRCIGMKPTESWLVAGHSHKIDPVLIVNDLELGCEAAIEGVGIARAPWLVCREAVLAGRLVVLFGADTQSAHPVYALYPSKHFLSAKVRVFMEMLEQLVEPTTLTDQRRKPPRTPTTPARAQRR